MTTKPNHVAAKPVTPPAPEVGGEIEAEDDMSPAGVEALKAKIEASSKPAVVPMAPLETPRAPAPTHEAPDPLAVSTPAAPSWGSLFVNESGEVVTVTVRNAENKPVVFQWCPGETKAFPQAYAHLLKNRAPQLRAAHLPPTKERSPEGFPLVGRR